MTVEQLKAALAARPFQPFTLRTADGQEYRVPHPDFIMYNSAMPRTAAVTLPDGAVVVIDLLLVPTLAYDPIPVRP